MKAQSKNEYLIDHELMTTKAFANHQIRDNYTFDQNENHGLVTIGRPRSSAYAIELSLTPRGYLIVTGDINTVVWSQSYRPIGEAIHQMATQCVGTAHQRARMGSGVEHRDWVWEYALWQAQDKLNDPDLFEYHPGWKKILDMIKAQDDRDEILQEIYDLEGEVGWFGMLPSSTFLWGWSALKCADRLLQERKRHGHP